MILQRHKKGKNEQGKFRSKFPLLEYQGPALPVAVSLAWFCLGGLGLGLKKGTRCIRLLTLVWALWVCDSGILDTTVTKPLSLKLHLQPD